MPSAIRNLSERRVPQVLAIYLGAAFGIVQFVDFVGSRYLLPAVWTDMSLLAMAVLLPSVLLYTYHHGRPGRDEWQRSEKIFIPINLVVLIALVTVVGAGAPLGPTSKRITVTDEKGNTREAVVPHKAYRKRVALFMFDSVNGDSATQWLQYGLPLLTAEDLAQQSFIEPMQPALLQEGLRKAGFDDGVGVPLTLKREVAKEMHLPHFLAGKIEKVGANYIATVQLYETSNAKLLKENRFESTDPAQLADQISASLVRDMDIPQISDAAPEMPVAEVLSTNPTALRNYAEAVAAATIKNDYGRALDRNTKAIALDKTFASAHLLQGSLAMLTNQQQLAATSMKAAMDHSYRLPERTKEVTKAVFYNAQGDYVRAFAVLEMLAQLYPEDIQVQTMFLQVQQVRDDTDAMVRTMQKILELDPSRAELMLQLGTVYERKGDSRRALEQYASYEKKIASDPRGPRRAAALHRKMGDHTAARAAAEKAVLLKPDDPATLVELASLDRVLGNFDAAQQRLDEAMSLARTPQQRSSVLTGVSDLRTFRGDIRGGVAAYEAALVEDAKYQPPAVVLVGRLALPGRIARVDAAAAKRELDRLHAGLQKPWDIYLPVAELQYYIEVDDAANAAKAVTSLEALIAKQNFKIFNTLSRYARARISEIRGDCKAAVTYHNEVLKLDPMDINTHTYLGRCYRKLGDRAKAEAQLGQAIRIAPASGMANMEMGLLMKDAGDANKARGYLDRALATWQNADPNYKPARQAREALSTL
jgi:tetratricopeptide (TPR) repeat protein